MWAIQTRFFNWNKNLRFGRLVFEKTKKVKNVGQIFISQTFSKAFVVN